MTVAIPDPYDRTEFRGRPLDYATVAGCLLVEKRLGYQLTILQGIGGNPSSAGTHLDGRFVDLAPYDGDAKEKAWRSLVGIGWVREELPGEWSAHVHCGNVFESPTNERGIAPAGFRQIGYYNRGLDGLADMRPDPHPGNRPTMVLTLDMYRATMVDWLHLGDPVKPTRVTRARDAMVEADADLGNSVAMLKALPADDDQRAFIDGLQRQRKAIRAKLAKMDKR